MKILDDTHPQELLTADLPLACFLCVRGVPLQDFRADGNSSRVFFVFPNTTEVSQLRMAFLNNEPVPVRTFYSTLRDLKRRVYEYRDMRR